MWPYTARKCVEIIFKGYGQVSWTVLVMHTHLGFTKGPLPPNTAFLTSWATRVVFAVNAMTAPSIKFSLSTMRQRRARGCANTVLKSLM